MLLLKVHFEYLEMTIDDVKLNIELIQEIVDIIH